MSLFTASARVLPIGAGGVNPGCSERNGGWPSGNWNAGRDPIIDLDRSEELTSEL